MWQLKQFLLAVALTAITTLSPGSGSGSGSAEASTTIAVDAASAESDASAAILETAIPGDTVKAAARPAALVGCPAGQWVQVAWFIHPFWPESHWYVADQPWIHINWRWFSGGPVPYWQGGFDGRANITAPPAPYTSIEFWCSTTTNIQVV